MKPTTSRTFSDGCDQFDSLVPFAHLQLCGNGPVRVNQNNDMFTIFASRGDSTVTINKSPAMIAALKHIVAHMEDVDWQREAETNGKFELQYVEEREAIKKIVGHDESGLTLVEAVRSVMSSLCTANEINDASERSRANLLIYATSPTPEHWESLTMSGVDLAIRDAIKSMSEKQYRCNICGGQVAFDGTAPTTSVGPGRKPSARADRRPAVTMITTLPSAEEACRDLDIAFVPQRYNPPDAIDPDTVIALVHGAWVPVQLASIDESKPWSMKATATYRLRRLKLIGNIYAEGVEWIAVSTRGDEED